MSSSFEFPTEALGPKDVNKTPGNSIKALGKASKPSRIPAPSPGDYATPEALIKSRSVFAETLPTPSRCQTEDTLANVATQLEQTLAKEQEALEAARKQLKAAPEGSFQAASANKKVEEAQARIDAINTKLTRTKHALQRWQHASNEYTASARKAQATRSRLQDAEAGKVRGLKDADLAKLRQDVAETAKQMAQAAHQLQSMEQICEMLMQELGERTSELANLQKELVESSGEVAALTASRDALAQKYAQVEGAAAALQQEDEALKAKLVGLEQEPSYKGAGLYHYISRSLTDFQAKMKRRSGLGGSKTMADFYEYEHRCLSTCTEAVPLGEALAAKYDLNRNVPQTCLPQHAPPPSQQQQPEQQA